ncbi:MAG: hypothetical protein ACMUEM_03050 [Flavobacteriales bacterium AspAUS03]
MVGAIYGRDEIASKPTEKALATLLAKLERFFSGRFEFNAHQVGIRPTVVKQSRPLVGWHAEHPSLTILNRLGSHGTLLRHQWITRLLFEYLEYGDTDLPQELDIKRF